MHLGDSILIGITTPLFILYLIFLIVCIADMRNEDRSVVGFPKLVWALLCIALCYIGCGLYWFVGRKKTV